MGLACMGPSWWRSSACVLLSLAMRGMQTRRNIIIIISSSSSSSGSSSTSSTSSTSTSTGGSNSSSSSNNSSMGAAVLERLLSRRMPCSDSSPVGSPCARRWTTLP